MEKIQARLAQQADLPVEITPTLYLGNAAAAHDVPKLQRLGISRILNMAGPTAVHPATVEDYAKHGITYKVIDAQDEEDYPLLDKHWEEAHAFITVGDKNEKVLVHCVAGHNRSSLIVAAQCLVMSSNDNSSVVETMRHIRLQRGNVALQNESFQEQLVAFAREHGRLGPPPTPLCPPPRRDKKQSMQRENPLDKLAF